MMVGLVIATDYATKVRKKILIKTLYVVTLQMTCLVDVLFVWLDDLNHMIQFKSVSFPL